MCIAYARECVDKKKGELMLLLILKCSPYLSRGAALIIYLISNKLDSSSKREWESSIANTTNETPSLDKFVSFLTNRCHVLETLQPNHHNQFSKGQTNKTVLP